MHLGYVHSTGFPSLAANAVQIVQMCRAFAKTANQVTLFVPRSERYLTDHAAREAARRMYGENFPFEVVFVNRVRWFGRMEVLGSVRGTIQAIAEHKPDIIYSRNPWSILFLGRTGVPFAFEAHEERVHATSDLLNHFVLSKIVRASRGESCRLIVTISEALRRIWEGYGVPANKLLSAHDGVDLEMFATGMTKSDARKELDISSDKPVVVYTGALRADRGIDLILAAAEKLRHMNFYFVGGTDQEIDHYRNLTKARYFDNAHFAGRVEHHEVPTWLAAADILLMMWTWEVRTMRGCSPMKMFEYMAAKRLIVGPAFPTILEVLEDGSDSILFEPDNLDGLIEALKKSSHTLQDPALPASAFSKVSSEYTWDSRCRKILRALSMPE